MTGGVGNGGEVGPPRVHGASGFRSAQPLAKQQFDGLAALAALGKDGDYSADLAITEPFRRIPLAPPVLPVLPARPRPPDAQPAVSRPSPSPSDYIQPRNAKLPLRQRLTYALVLIVGLALAARFAYFWFSPDRLPRDFGRHLDAGDIIMFAALTFVVWHRQLIDMCAWLICTRVEAFQPAPPPPPGLKVAFITTFVPSSESIDMLAKTLASIVRVDYPHDTWLLDEGNDEQARELCGQLGVKYFTRKGKETLNRERGVFLAKSKGGNHNSWYVRHGRDYDFVAQVDSDFVVRRDFLLQTLGHFRNPDIAFVGTPQIYGNTGNFISRGAAHQTYLFYGPILRALSRRRMALLIGANHIIRVAALQEIGWYQGHLTEDLATGKRFHAKRWQSVYVPLPLAIGEGPTTWAAYFSQQYRWATGCMHIFFSQSPWLNVQMRRAHAFYYFLLEQFYFSGLSFVVAVTLLLFYYAFGWRPANIQIGELAYWYAPLLVWRQLIIFWLQRFNVRPTQERGVLWAGRSSPSPPYPSTSSPSSASCARSASRSRPPPKAGPRAARSTGSACSRRTW